MDKTIRVSIDKSTWPGAPTFPNFPATFKGLGPIWTLNVPSLLLVIGYMTTPAHPAKASLSEYWAWIRYLNAISPDAELKLTREFSDLDSHQKTILSDDFGMGLPLYWLQQKLSIAEVVDGRYFIDRLASKLGIPKPAKAKRGPSKSPDFVMLDTAGTWHVVECKGTQEGPGYRNRQLVSAISQKRVLKFPPTHTGQALASGVFIGVENGSHATSLHLIDPPNGEELVLDADQMHLAEDTLVRSSDARALRLSGFPETAALVSAPDGQEPSDGPISGDEETARIQVVEEKRSRAAAELSTTSGRQTFTANGVLYIGRIAVLPLSAPVWNGKRFVTWVRVRMGSTRTFLDQVGSVDLAGGQSYDTPTGRRPVGQIALDGDDSGASIRVGKHFFADLLLHDEPIAEN